MDEEQSEHQKALMAALDFTADDLAANRAGELSDWQQWKLRETSLKSRNLSGALTFFGVMLAVPVLCILINGTNQVDTGTMGIVFGVAIPLVIAFGYWRRSRAALNATRTDIPVGMVEGQVKVNLADPSYGIYDEVVVNDVHTQTRKSGRAFILGGRYRVYYQPFTKEILSAEWIGG